MEFETIRVQSSEDGALVLMNRPDRRNAFNSKMVQELTVAFEELRNDPAHLIVLTGAGKAFSAGADLEYMSSIRNAGEEENIRDAEALADLLDLIYSHPKPVIARVNGPAIGGGLGLVCACDMAFAVESAFFAFSEVRLGLVPAVIGPYAVRVLGERQARRWMLTGDKIDLEQALAMGLVNEVATPEELDAKILAVAQSINASGPEALAACKELVHRSGQEELADVKPWTARLIAKLRAGKEGQEGMNAFLEKRAPGWQGPKATR